MELSEFNNHYLSNLLDNLSDENKTVVLTGDFNADLLKYDKDCNVSDFLDTMYSNLLLPHIASPTRVTQKLLLIASFLTTMILLLLREI